MGRIIYSYSRMEGENLGVTRVADKNGIRFGTDIGAAKQAMKEEAEKEMDRSNAKLKADGKTKEGAGYWLNERNNGWIIELCWQESDKEKEYDPKISWQLMSGEC